MEAWLQAYHSRHSTSSSLTLKYQKLAFHSGVIQAGLNLDFGNSSTYSGVGVQSEGTNGQMPNLDLINVLSRVAAPDGIPLSLHGQVFTSTGVDFPYSEYLSSLKNILYMMRQHVSGMPSGAHGAFHKYALDLVHFDSRKFVDTKWTL